MATGSRMTDRERRNRQVIEYLLGRLGDKTSAGQCILHLAPGGEIKKIEWRETEDVEGVFTKG